MNDLLVVMAASCMHGTMALYCEQLTEAGIEWRIMDNRDNPNLNGGGNLGYRVKKFREWATMFQQYEKLIFSDAFDVTFYGTKEEVIEKIPADHILHAAEKNCYPDPSVAPRIGVPGPWRFANGGLVAGTPQTFAEWCFAAEVHPRYNPRVLDQQFLNECVAEQSLLCDIDHRTELFFCLFGGYEELSWENGIPINTLYDTRPKFLHCQWQVGRDRSLQETR